MSARLYIVEGPDGARVGSIRAMNGAEALRGFVQHFRHVPRRGLAARKAKEGERP